MKFKSIKRRTLFVMIPTIIIGLTLLIVLSYINAKNTINEQIDSRMNTELMLTTEKIESQINIHNELLTSVAKTLSNEDVLKLDLNAYHSILSNNVSINQGTYGLGIFFEPNQYDKNLRYFSTYVYRNKTKIVSTEDYSQPTYNYLAQDWYKAGKETKSVAITQPYYDDVQKKSFVTSATPFYSNGKFAGVLTGDLDLSQLQKLFKDIKVGETGYAFLLNSDGTYLAAKDPGKDMKQNILKETNASLVSVGEKMLKMKPTMGRPGLSAPQTTFIENGITYRVFYGVAPSTNWKIAFAISDEELMAPVQSLLLTLSIIGMVVLVVLNFIIILNSNYITNNIRKVKDLSSHLSNGDLTKQLDIQSSDEFGEMTSNFNQMIANLKSIIGNVVEHSKSVAHVTQDVSHKSTETKLISEQVVKEIGEVSSGAVVQTRSAEDSVTTMKEMSIGIQKIAESSAAISESSSSVTNEAEEGNSVITKSVDQMKVIQKTMNESVELVNKLEAHSKEIAKITDAITQITEQTNLLALNASIEAARAGEHGKGFAVVADEVRKLAEQSKHSATEIAGLIKQIEADTQLTAQSLRKGEVEVTNGTSAITNAGSIFKKIFKDIQSVNQQILDTSAFTEEISASFEEVEAATQESLQIATKALNSTERVQKVSAQQVGALDEVVVSINKLNSMTEELKSLIETFKLS